MTFALPPPLPRTLVGVLSVAQLGRSAAPSVAMLSIARQQTKMPVAMPAGKTMLDGCAFTADRSGHHAATGLRRAGFAAEPTELDRIEARYGLDVFWKAFLANRAGYQLGIPRVPLSELYDGCRAAIERRGGEVALRAPVRRLRAVVDSRSSRRRNGRRI